MKGLLILVAGGLLSCSRNGSAPTVTDQQIECLNKRRDYVNRAIVANKQTLVGMEEDIALFKTPEGRIIGYLIEQGECSTVLTQLPSGGKEPAEQFIAAEVKKNYGPLFITKENVRYKYYTARQGAHDYIVAQALN